MAQVEKLVEALEEKYRIRIADFIELYKNMYTREEIANELSCGEWGVRAAASALNLRMAKKHREHDYALYLSRFADIGSETTTRELTQALQDLDTLSQDLVNKEKLLHRARLEITKYKKAITSEVILDTFREVADEAIATLQQVTLVQGIPTDPIVHNRGDYTQFVLLSDLHFEATVSQGDVGKINEYTWEIAESRLAKVFNNLIASRNGESNCVVLGAGDWLDGLIHNSLETSSKPLGKAVADLAVIMAEHIKHLATIYHNIYIPLVSGNHERLTDYKRSHNQGFGFAYMLYELLASLISHLPNVRTEISTNGYLSFAIGESIIGLTHGDFIKGSTNDIKIMKTREAFKQITGYIPRHIFSGHTHQPEIKLFGSSDYYIVSGSLIGANAYSVTNGFTNIDWCQVIGSFDEIGNIDYTKFIS